LTSEPLKDALAEARVLPFRRRAFSARRKRRPLWLLLGVPLAGALSIVAVPAALVVWVLHSSRFALRDVVVESGPRVPRGWVEQALQPLLGGNLIRLRLGDARARLAGHPWLEAAEIGKELPRRLRVRVIERHAVALLRNGAVLSYLDPHGRAIAPWSPQGDEDLLIVAAPETAEPAELVAALDVARALERSAPGWAAALSEVEVLGEDEFRLTTAAVPFPLVVRASTLELGARRLQSLLPDISRRYPRVEAVDLRSERRIVIEPAVGPAESGTPTRPPAVAPAPAAARAAA
jgi:cell division septal protein FtsQ